MTLANRELHIYIHNKKDTRQVDYGEDGQAFMDADICNVQVALNNKFFMIGIPSKRAIGFFGLNRVQLSTKPLKWVTKVSNPLNNYNPLLTHTLPHIVSV